LSHLAGPHVQPDGAAVLLLTISSVGTAVLSFSATAPDTFSNCRGRPGLRHPAGGNELIILELHAASAAVAFRPGLDLGHTEL
jgi:hypothetical protein